MTYRAGIIGFPVAQSRSPYIHEFWLQKHGIKGSYEKFDVAPDNFESFVRHLCQTGYSGVNITIPHKESAFRISDDSDELATMLQASNTLIFNDKKIIARNTDGMGFISGLKKQSNLCAEWYLKPALILGAGGAAKAIVFALAKAGVQEIRMANRSIEKIKSFELLLKNTKTKLVTVEWDQREFVQEDIGLLVNTTSLGMVGKPELIMDLSLLAHDAVVYDIVYVPLETSLLAQARKKGHICVDGLAMLLHQASPGFEAWSGVYPEVTDSLKHHVLGTF